MVDWQPFGEKSMRFITRPIALDKRITLLEGSVRSAKTISMIPKWLNYIMNGPKGLLLMCGVSKETVYDNVLRDLFDTVGNNNYHYNRSSGELRIYAREIKVIGAKDEGSEKYLRGKTLAGANCDELSLIPKRFFLQLMNRCSIAGAKIYGTTNPDNPSHWLYTDYIINPEKFDIFESIHFNLEDNPNLPPDYVRDIKKSYSGVFYKRFILGQWVVAEGAVYDMLTDDNFYKGEIPDYIRDAGSHFIACDYGTQNAAVFLHIILYNGIVYIENEYYYSGRTQGVQKTDSQYLEDFKEFIAPFKEKLNQVIIDPSAASFRAELRNADFLVKDAVNDVLDGVRVTGAMFKQCRIKINEDNCPNVKREVYGYRWNEKKLDNKKSVEEPIKQEDHSLDAIRYFCYTFKGLLRIN